MLCTCNFKRKKNRNKYKTKLKAVKFYDFIRNFSGNNFISHALVYPASMNYSKVIFDSNFSFPLENALSTEVSY